jgi:hypothetical protein
MSGARLRSQDETLTSLDALWHIGVQRELYAEALFDGARRFGGRGGGLDIADTGLLAQVLHEYSSIAGLTGHLKWLMELSGDFALSIFVPLQLSFLTKLLFTRARASSQSRSGM